MMNMLVAKPASAVEAPKRSVANFDTTVMSSQKFTATRKFSMVMTTKLLVQSSAWSWFGLSRPAS